MDLCSNVGLYVDYSRIVESHMCAVWLVYLFRGICQECEMYVYQCFGLIIHDCIGDIHTEIPEFYLHMK